MQLNMTVEKDGVRSSSPVHLHVDDDTPVHVHVKGKPAVTSVSSKKHGSKSTTIEVRSADVSDVSEQQLGGSVVGCVMVLFTYHAT